MTIKELQEKRAELAAEIRRQADSFNDAGHVETPEEREAWEKVNKDYNGVAQRLEAQLRADEIEREISETANDRERRAVEAAGSSRERAGVPSKEDRSLAFQAWALPDKQDLTDEHRAACAKCRIDPMGKRIDMRLMSTRELRDEHRALSKTATAGLEYVPEGFVAQLERALLAGGQMRQAGTVFRTAGGGDLPWPTMDDSSNEAEVVAEGVDNTTADPTTGAITFYARKYSTRQIIVSSELLQDSEFDLATELGRMMGDRFARGMNNGYTVGNPGASPAEPNGIMNDTVEGVSLSIGGGDVLDGDAVINLMHSVDPSYRRPGFGFMCHDTYIAELRLIRDESGGAGTGQYLWQPGLQAGQPDRLLGWPLYYNQHMTDNSSPGAGQLIMIGGDLSLYRIRDVGTVRVLRSEHRYVENDQVVFIGWMRTDGSLLDAGTNPVKHIALAA